MSLLLFSMMVINSPKSNALTQISGADVIPDISNLAVYRADILKEQADKRFDMTYSHNKWEEEMLLAELPLKHMPVQALTSTKRYMDYRTITDKRSLQYDITRRASVSLDDGLLRTADGYICVALGQKYGKVGDKFQIDIGDKFVKCILADVKADCDTLNGEGWLDPNGDVMEIIVDQDYINSTCKTMGNMDYCSTLQGTVKGIYKERDYD